MRGDAACREDGRSRALAAWLGFNGARIKIPETGDEIDVHFADDTTAEVGLNNYEHMLKKRRSDVVNLHSHRKQGEMPRRLTAVGAVCVSDATS